MIFAVQYCRPFYVFSRERCDTKITELLELFELSECMVSPEQVKELSVPQIDYQIVHERMQTLLEVLTSFTITVINLI